MRPPRERRTRHPYQSSHPTPATTTTTGYWGPLYRLMEYALDDATANSQEPTGDLPVGRAALQAQRRTVRVRVRTRCALRRRPPAGRHKFQGQQSVDGPPLEMSPPGEPIASGKCGDALPAHMRAAGGKLSSGLRVHERKVMDRLQLWWHTALLWIWDRPLAPEVKRADLQLLHEVLHELAVNGPPGDASSPVLAEGRKVSVQLAAKGLRSAGSVQVPPAVWEQWADPCFEWAGRNAPTQPHSRCPKAQALLTALERQGLVEGTREAPNASVFVKWKSVAKAALILSMKAFNHTCAYKARRFRLPTLEGLADLLRAVGGVGDKN